MWRAKPGDDKAFLKISKTPVKRGSVGRCSGQKHSHTGRSLASGTSIQTKPQNSTSPTYRWCAGPPLFETRQKQPFYFYISVLLPYPPFSHLFQPFHGVKIHRRDPQSLPDAADYRLPGCLPDPAKLPPNSIPFVPLINTALLFPASCGWHMPTSSTHTYA